MAGLLPHPEDAGDIIELVKPMVDIPMKDMWKGRKADPLIMVRTVKKHGIVKPKNDYYEVLNQHLYLRACNQVNEACNKLWATCELYHHLSTNDRAGWLCDSFSPGFSPSSTIPTLYYADISSLLAILSFFGVGSFRVKEKRWTSYDVVRCAEGFQIEERATHLKSLTNKPFRGWHDQVALLYECLQANGIGLPKINMGNFSRLKQDRMAFHYGLLTKTTMDGAFGERQFFVHLPHVIFVTLMALYHLQKLTKPLHNSCDVRFTELLSKILPLGKGYLGETSTDYRRLESGVKESLAMLSQTPPSLSEGLI